MSTRAAFSLGLMLGATTSYIVERVAFKLFTAYDIRVELRKLTD